MERECQGLVRGQHAVVPDPFSAKFGTQIHGLAPDAFSRNLGTRVHEDYIYRLRFIGVAGVVSTTSFLRPLVQLRSFSIPSRPPSMRRYTKTICIDSVLSVLQCCDLIRAMESNFDSFVLFRSLHGLAPIPTTPVSTPPLTLAKHLRLTCTRCFVCCRSSRARV